MRRETGIIVLLIAVVLVPMWYIALTSGTEGGGLALGTGATPVAVNTSAQLNPTGSFISGPTEVGVNQAGVIAWAALLGMVGVMVGAKQFVDRIGELREPVSADGGHTVVAVPPYLSTDDRRILEYIPSPNSTTGLAVVACLSWASVTFASLLVLEGFHQARTQFLGAYAGMLFVSLAILVMAYFSYFVPTVTVEERREHGIQDDS